MGRKEAVAAWCQLVTGSYDGATRSCSCANSGECILSQAEREKALRDPKVIAARDRNLKEFRDCKTNLA